MESLKRTLLGIAKYFRERYYLATAPLMFFSFPSHDFWFLKGFPFFAWVSLVPLFIFIRNKSFREITWYSFIVFLLGNFLAFNWIGHFGADVKGGYAVIVAFLMPSLTVFMVLKILLAEWLSRRCEPLRFILFPSVWLLIDWVQSLGFLAFPWTYWGYSQYPFTAFIQAARVTGILGITFMLVAVNYLLADLMYHARENGTTFLGLPALPEFRRLAAALVLVAVFTVAGSFVLMTQKGSGNGDLRVAMVQTCVDPWDNWRRNRMMYLDQLIHHSENAMREDPDLMIWSESATLETISYDYAQGTPDMFAQRLLEFVRRIGRPLLTGEIGRIDDAIYGNSYYQNNAVLINENGEVVKSYAKINLVPFGEWFPYERWFQWVKNIADSFGASSFTPGSELDTFEVRGFRFGTLVCYEGIFFQHCRRYIGLGVHFLVNITNDGWTDTYNGHMQHFAASVFRAVENGIWMVRAGNTGYSTLIDPYGRVTASMPILTRGYVSGNMDFSLNHPTFYSRLGDVFFYIVLLFPAFVGASAFVQKLKGRVTKKTGV